MSRYVGYRPGVFGLLVIGLCVLYFAALVALLWTVVVILSVVYIVAYIGYHSIRSYQHKRALRPAKTLYKPRHYARVY